MNADHTYTHTSYIYCMDQLYVDELALVMQLIMVACIGKWQTHLIMICHSN